MNKKTQPVLIGIFVIFSVLLFMIAVVIFGSNRFFEKENLVIAYFEGSLQGLSVGAPVTYRGVSIGQVKEVKIHITTNNGETNRKLIIPVIISLSAGKALAIDNLTTGKDVKVNNFLREMCQDGLRAKLKVVSIVTGKRYIDLAFYENSTPVYRDTIGQYFEIPTLPSEMQQLGKMIENIDIGLLYQRAIGTLTSLEQLTSGLAKTLNSDTTENLINEISSTTSNLNQILVQLNSTFPSILTKMDTGLDQINALSSNADNIVVSLDEHLPPIVNSIETALIGINSTISQANRFITQADTVLKPSSPLQRNLSVTLRQLQNTAASIERLSDYIHRNPNTLIFGLQNSGEKNND